MLGKKVSEAEIDLFRASQKKGVIDFRENRIILPEEFYNKEERANLYWQELAEVKRGGSNLNGDILPTYLGGFDGLFIELLRELYKKNLMSEGSLCAGDYVLIPVGGIDVNPGKYPHTAVTFYPRVREDAEEYAKYFFGDASYPVYVAQVLSVPNRKEGYFQKKGK